jgi:hypothetical protein
MDQWYWNNNDDDDDDDDDDDPLQCMSPKLFLYTPKAQRGAVLVHRQSHWVFDEAFQTEWVTYGKADCDEGRETGRSPF